MAWRCTGTTNAELIANMAKADIIHSDRVTAAMTKVDRANYVRYANDAYEDSPQTIGYGATISAPHMHAHAVEYLLPFLKPGSRVLDVGSGSGYLSAVLYQLLEDPSDPRNKDSKVVGIEHVSELVEWSVGNLRKDGLGSPLDKGQIKMIAGDGRKGMYSTAAHTLDRRLPEDGSYDAIHVGAAAPTLPKELVEQLARPGRMFIPVGTRTQQVLQIDKDADGNVTKKPLFDVLYVPLTDRDKQS